MASVVFFVTNLDAGGLENYLLRFLQLYASRFDDVIVFCKGAKGGVLEPNFVALKNVRVVKKKIGNYHPHHYVWLKRWFSRHSDHIVCDFTGNFAGPVLWAAKKSTVSKRIAFYRSSSNRFKETPIRLKINSFYNSLVRRFATNIYANSKFAFSFYFSNSNIDERFKVIYNGLNIAAFLSEHENLREEFKIAPNTFVVGHTGRFNPAKNHKAILEVAARILAVKKDVVFIMCGKGVKHHLDNTVRKSGYDKNILLFENRSDIGKFLNTCDAYIFPSITEGQPNSLIEAWVKGLPFVASNIPPIKDLIPTEFDRYLVSPNDVEQMTSLLINIIDGDFDSRQRETLAKWAQDSFDGQIRFEEFYQELITI